MVPHYGAQADSGRALDAQACSGFHQVRSPSAQDKAAAARVWRLKRKQRG